MFDATNTHMHALYNSHNSPCSSSSSSFSFHFYSSSQDAESTAIQHGTMNNPNDTEMPDTHDSSGLLDDTRSETISLADRPKGSKLRQRHHQEVNESFTDYADLFRALQIRPESYERFLNGVLKVLRQKNVKELQSGTDAKIRHLSWLVLRGYRSIIWKEGSKWLLEDEELEEGEKRLLHGGDNERSVL
jgi:hypothetical protein